MWWWGALCAPKGNESTQLPFPAWGVPLSTLGTATKPRCASAQWGIRPFAVPVLRRHAELCWPRSRRERLGTAAAAWHQRREQPVLLP